MKLKILTIKNIASIENALIDFTATPLCSAPLFLISGETGAGKTTILDAICLALYGDTPRLSVAASSKVPFGPDSITSKNPSNLLRHGTSEAFAQLEFTGSDGKEYIARWETGRKRTMTLRTATNSLTINGVPFSGKEREIEHIIKTQAVGLDFEQFCRTTLLAQGQFTQFLKSKDNEKAEILEKITGTEIYSEIGRKIAAVTKEKENAYNNQRLRTEGIIVLSPAELENISNAITSAQNETSSLSEKIASLQRKIEWFTRCNRLNEEINALSMQHTRLIHEISTDEYQYNEKLIHDWDNSADARQWIRTYNECAAKLAQCSQRSILYKQRFTDLVAGRNFISGQLGIEQQTASDLELSLQRETPHAAIFDNIAVIHSLIDRYRDAVTQEKRERQSLHQCDIEISLHAPAVKEAADKAEVAKKDTALVQQGINDTREHLARYDIVGLSDRLNHINNRLNSIISTETLYSDISYLKKEHAATQSRLNELTEAIARDKEQVSQSTVRRDHIQEELNRLQLIYDKMELSVNEWTVQIRKSLSKGDTCPVCGFTIDTLLSDDQCQSKIAPIKEEITRRKLELEQTTLNIKALNSEISRNEKEGDILAGKLKELCSSIAQISNNLDNLCDSLSIPHYSSDSDLFHLGLEQVKKATEAERDAAFVTDKEIQRLQKSLKDLNERKDNLVKTEMAATEALTTARTKATQLSQKRDEHIKNIQECENIENRHIASISQYLGSIADWRTSLIDNPDRLKAELMRMTTEHNAIKERLNSIKVNIQANSITLDTVDNCIATVRALWNNWVADDTAPAAEVNDLAAQWQQFAADASALSSESHSLQTEFNRLHSALDKFYAENAHITPDRLAVLSTTTDIPRIRAHQQSVKNELSESEGALKSRQDDLTRHLAQKEALIDENDSLENLTGTLASLNNSLIEKTKELGAMQQRMSDHNNNIERVAGEKRKEEELRLEYEKWSALKNLLGGTDNTGFRKIAQGYVLNDLLTRANHYLRKLNRRYSMDCDMSTLTIRMHDNYQGGTQGPVDILSGGESFMVSLSLALALSSINRKGMHINTLFIDEGFGSLSGDCLNSVMDMLERLHLMNGKSVGIISHVDSLKERIPVQILVTRTDNTRSSVKVIDKTAE